MVLLATATAVGTLALRARSAPGPELADAYAEAITATGTDYLAVRDRILRMDQAEVVSFLQGRRSAVTDPLTSLFTDALLARAKDPARVERALTLAFAAGQQGPPSITGLSTGPSPVAGSARLIHELADAAVPVATELLCKDLTSGWPSWKRQTLATCFFRFGRRPVATTSRTQMKDPRAGWPLLWLLEHEGDEACVRWALRSIRSFASANLLVAAEASLARAAPSRQQNLEFALGSVRSALQSEAGPASVLHSVATTLPFRLEMDGMRELTDAEQTEHDRLLAIARDAAESLPARILAVRLVGQNVAHQTCLPPLEAIVNDDTQPAKLRIAALNAIGMIPVPEAIPFVIDTIAHRDSAMRAYAVEQFRRLTATTDGPRPHSTRDPTTQKQFVALCHDWWEQHRQDFTSTRIRAILLH